MLTFVRLAAAAVLAAAALPGAAVAAQTDGPLDVRDAYRDAAAARPSAATRATQQRASALADRLGDGAVVHVDPLSGTVDRLQRLDGALSSPSGAAPVAVARHFVADHARTLGLGADDATAMSVTAQTRSPTGLTVITLGQDVGGVPLFDGGLRVGVDRAGRVLSLAGTPRSDLPASLPPATLTAAAAIARVVPGAQPAAQDLRRLVVFSARQPHLAWHVTHQQDSTHWWDAVVDARTGQVLYRANLVKAVDAEVFTNYPGYAPNGSATVTLPLDPGATTMSGPDAYAYADLNDNNTADPGEDTAPPATPTSYGLLSTTTSPCDATHLCTWDGTFATALQNQNQSVLQAFWYVSAFHDHLAAAPIGFDAGDPAGNFEGASDRVLVEALDGANVTGSGPDANHLNNANMATPPAGANPRMQMYLFHDPGWFRDVNGGDDAAIVYHEYTHGLSSRLVTYSDGSEALNLPQPGAMGEAWSDYYAMDALAQQGLVTDTATDGDVYMGRYTDEAFGAIRYEAMDCPVDSGDDQACHNPVTGAAGGFTYAHFGRIWGLGPEVHADGEIWGQTLWQLRAALIAKQGSAAAGASTADEIITDAMRLSPPEPSFLDMRNAILAADLNANGGANHDVIWSVFAQRGMGYFASAIDGGDVRPVADTQLPPDPNAPRGAIAGTVTDATTGLPVAGATVGVAGLTTGLGSEDHLSADGDGNGRYSIGDVPPAQYPAVTATAPLYARGAASVQVTAGATATGDIALQRNRSAAAGGATISATNANTYDSVGCGPAAAIDGGGTGWSADNPHSADPAQAPTLTVRLPEAISVQGFGLDPGATCGDDLRASTKDYKLEASPDGVTFTTVATGTFTSAQAWRMNHVAAAPVTDDVRYVRLTLLSALDNTNADYIDLTALEVYGAPPNTLPSGALTVSTTTPQVGQSVTFDASSFQDPDSAITGYTWDFDGDGTVDRTTTAPTTTFTYMSSGTMRPRVAAEDFRGGAGTATASVGVQPGATATTTAPTTTATTTTPAPTPWLFPAQSKARAVLTLPRSGTRSRVRLKVRCRDACRLSGTLTVTPALRRKLHLRWRTVGRITPRTLTGTRMVTVTLTAATRRHLRLRHVRRVTVALRVRATVSGGQTASAARRVRVSR